MVRRSDQSRSSEEPDGILEVLRHAAACQANLSGRLDAFEEAEEDDDPGQGQAAQDGESNLSQVPDVVGDVQNVAPWRKRRFEWLGWQQTPTLPIKKNKNKNHYWQASHC